jgi:hypothetical protein
LNWRAGKATLMPLAPRTSEFAYPRSGRGDPEQEYFVDGIDDMKRDREGELHPG